jgi:hypothetical protein
VQLQLYLRFCLFSAFMDGYHGDHEDYLTVIGMFKNHKFPTLKAAEQKIYNETSGAVMLNHYHFDPAQPLAATEPCSTA